MGPGRLHDASTHPAPYEADRAHPGTPGGRGEATRKEPGSSGMFSPGMIPESAPEQLGLPG